MSEASPSISVVMAMFNAGPFVADAVTSILNQTFRDFEFLILDDGSTDNGLEKVRAFQDPRIRVFSSPEHRGKVPQLNFAWEIARGKYIANMDADDISLPRRLEKQLQFLENNPHIGICDTFFRMFGRASFTSSETFSDKERATTLFFRTNTNAHGTTMLRRAAVEKAGVRYRDDCPVSEDYAFWVDLAEHTEYHRLPEVHYLYRIHEANTSHVHRPRQMESREKILRRTIARFGKLSPSEDRETVDLIYAFLHSARADFSDLERSAIKAFIVEVFKSPKVDPGTLIRAVGAERFATVVGELEDSGVS